MNKFQRWLSQEWGRAEQLSRQLKLTRGSVSNVRNGRRLMPNGWMETIVQMSNGYLDYKYLVLLRARQRNTLRKEKQKLQQTF